MKILKRFIQSYKVYVGGVLILGLVWAANQFLLKSTAAVTGWPVLIGITVLLVILTVWVRQLGGSPETRSVQERHHLPGRIRFDGLLNKTRKS